MKFLMSKIKGFFKILLLILLLPLELSNGKKRKVKKQIRNYFFNL